MSSCCALVLDIICFWFLISNLLNLFWLDFSLLVTPFSFAPLHVPPPTFSACIVTIPLVLLLLLTVLSVGLYESICLPVNYCYYVVSIFTLAAFISLSYFSVKLFWSIFFVIDDPTWFVWGELPGRFLADCGTYRTSLLFYLLSFWAAVDVKACWRFKGGTIRASTSCFFLRFYTEKSSCFKS